MNGQRRVVLITDVVPHHWLSTFVELSKRAPYWWHFRLNRFDPLSALFTVGSGPEEGRLRSLVSGLGIPNVVLCGAVRQSEMPEIYGAADAFVFPTLHDPFGMVLLEAAASGLALISSPYAGATRDLIEEGRSGVVVDPRDINGMASAMLRLARKPDERERLARAACESALERTPIASAEAFMRAIEAAPSLYRTAS